MATREWLWKDGFLVNTRLSALGLRHGVTTRQLGNMKDESCRRAAAAILGLFAPLTLKQVHGAKILAAFAENDGLEADGWILDVPGVSVGVYAADCVPLYLWSDDGKTAGVFHAGRRGAAAGMAKAAVAAFARLGVSASRLSASTGPHIGACCYKVSAELEKDFPSSSFVRRDGGLYLDLAVETRRQLFESGLRPDRVVTDSPCTASHPDEYFSFRRDKQDARMLALLSLEQWPS
ncbi:MAG: hypothetical protein A2V88_11410 [Elusimicrobia bacterium RBG_16_66_12]|nr:MAG: hypothetical protein A2V88_11410 [Elusimicrobia bacterium RBG_16_66_12]